MPKISDLTPVEELDGTESLLAIVEAEGETYLNVRVPLSVAMATIGAPAFAALTGEPGDNTALAAVLEAITAPETLEENGIEAGELALLDAVPLELVTGLDDALGDKADASAVSAALADKADTAAVTAALGEKANAASPVLTGDIQQNGRVRGNVTAVGASEIDCSAGNHFTKAMAGNLTFTFANVPAGSFGFVLELSYTSGTPTWPASVDWPGEAEPEWEAGKWLVMFLTSDGGTSFCGAALGPY